MLRSNLDSKHDPGQAQLRRWLHAALCLVCVLLLGFAAPSVAQEDECEPTGPEVCGDGIDNDCDGQVDFISEEVCGDGIDNDCDGTIDFDLMVNSFGDPADPSQADTGTCYLDDPPDCGLDVVNAADPLQALQDVGGCCLTSGVKQCNADNTGVDCVPYEGSSVREQLTEGGSHLYGGRRRRGL